jgi:hypothetical protein
MVNNLNKSWQLCLKDSTPGLKTSYHGGKEISCLMLRITRCPFAELLKNIHQLQTNTSDNFLEKDVMP